MVDLFAPDAEWEEAPKARRLRDLNVPLLRPLLVGAVVAGLLLAGAVFPFVGAGARGVSSAAGYWRDLPAELPEPPLPQGSVLVASDGKTRIATLFTFNRKVVDIRQISPVMQQAIVAIEDSRFYSNSGIDLRGTLRALVTTGSGASVQGGSTITQQLVKNTLLLTARTEKDQEAAAGRSLSRKLREAKYAVYLDSRYSKDQILGKYLNIAYFGAGAYGVEAAARRYFSQPAARLTLPQAALLAGIVQNPSAHDPVQHPEAATGRRNIVLARMHQLGRITDAQLSASLRTPLKLKPTVPSQGCSVSAVPFYCDWVTSKLLADPAMGKTPDERRRNLFEGGLTIRTSLDMAMQAKAQDAVDEVVPPSHRVAAVNVLVEPGTGLVRAMAVNHRYGTGKGETVFPLASVAAYQPGSTFKAFTLVAALEAGIPLSTTLPGGDRYTSEIFANPAKGYFTNADDGHGTNLTLGQSTAESVNTAFVQLQEKVGTLAVADAARRAGVHSLPVKGKGAVGKGEGSLSLGTREASPLEMASAYATLAAHGKACPPAALVGLTSATGRALPVPARACTQTISPAVADTVSSLLEGVLREGGTGESAALAGGRPAAGKTGTTENEAAAWFIGYAPKLAGAVLLVDPRGSQQYPLHDVLGVHRVYGGTLPASIWRRTMNAALDGTKVEQLPDANPAYLLPTSTSLMTSVVGLPVAEAQARLTALGLRSEVVQVDAAGQVRQLVPAGIVLQTSPAAGSPASRGSTVRLSVSR